MVLDYTKDIQLQVIQWLQLRSEKIACWWYSWTGLLELLPYTLSWQGLVPGGTSPQPRTAGRGAVYAGGSFGGLTPIMNSKRRATGGDIAWSAIHGRIGGNGSWSQPPFHASKVILLLAKGTSEAGVKSWDQYAAKVELRRAPRAGGLPLSGKSIIVKQRKAQRKPCRQVFRAHIKRQSLATDTVKASIQLEEQSAHQQW